MGGWRRERERVRSFWGGVASHDASEPPSFLPSFISLSRILGLTWRQVEGDPEGFAEEYPLEALEIATSDYMAKVRVRVGKGKKQV